MKFSVTYDIVTQESVQNSMEYLTGACESRALHVPEGVGSREMRKPIKRNPVAAALRRCGHRIVRSKKVYSRKRRGIAGS